MIACSKGILAQSKSGNTVPLRSKGRIGINSTKRDPRPTFPDATDRQGHLGAGSTTYKDQNIQMFGGGQQISGLKMQNEVVDVQSLFFCFCL